MYMKVETGFENQVFKAIFEKTSGKLGFPYNEPTGDEIRYLFLSFPVDPFLPQHVYEKALWEAAVGTMEVKLFASGIHSIVQPYIETDLSQHPKIKTFEDVTYEIGKLCIKDSYQGIGYLKKFFYILEEHHKETGSKQFLAQAILPLYEMLSKGMKLEITVLGEPDKDEIPGIPILVSMDDALKNPLIKRILSKKEVSYI